MSRAGKKKSGTQRKRGTVSLRPEVKELIDHAAGLVGYDRNQFTERLLRWFIREPRCVQLWALMLQDPPGPEAAERVRSLLERVAAEAKARGQCLPGRSEEVC